MERARDSNPRHPPWQGGALPTELRPQLILNYFKISSITRKIYIYKLKEFRFA